MNAVLKPAAELRPMVEADLPAVMAIENAIYAFPWTLGNFRDSLAAGYECWTYVRADELIGYAVLMYAADEAHLLNISIAAACQRQGHGSALLERVCELAHARGAHLLYLEVRPSNAGARQLYERCGFEHIGRRRDYYPAADGREDALVMGLQL